MILKKTLGLLVVVCSALGASSFKKNEAKVASEPKYEVRQVNYDDAKHMNLTSFDSYEIEEDERTYTVKAVKSYSPSIFEDIDNCGITDTLFRPNPKISVTDPFGGQSSFKPDHLKIEFEGIFFKRSRITTVQANFNNFSLTTVQGIEISQVNLIDGFVTYNTNFEPDVLFADVDGDVWLSDIKGTYLDETGFWDWLTNVVNTIGQAVQQVVETIVEVVEEIIEEFVEVVTDIVEHFVEVVVDVVEDVAEAIVNYLDNLNPDFVNMLQDVIDRGNPLEIIHFIFTHTSDFECWICNCLLDCAEWGMRNIVQCFCDCFGLENCAQLLCMYRGSDDDMHARQECWQELGGYNDIYDLVFHEFSSMAKLKYPFYDENNDGYDDYILWCWKGDYWSLGIGAEIGVYKRLNRSEHWIVDKDLSMNMSMVGWHRGNYFLDWNNEGEKSWWLTAFDPEEPKGRPTAHEVEIEYSVRFVTKGKPTSFNTAFYNAFKTKWCEGYYSPEEYSDDNPAWTYNDYYKTAYLDWEAIGY